MAAVPHIRHPFLVTLSLALLSASCSPSAPSSQGSLVPERIHAEGAPAAMGPYSQAIRVGETVYLAGQLGLDPATGELVEGGIQAETRQALENLGAVLAAAGLEFEHVVMSQVFLKEVEEFAAMNEVYGGYFGDTPPARATVEVARLPLDGRVEIQFTAVGPVP